MVAEHDPRFEFGKNWQSFLGLVDDARIEAAEQSLLQMLGTDDLTGSTLLDAGCGSGLFSLAAVRLGAKVHSFDYDPESVAATRELRRRHAPAADGWMVEQGSVLDRDYMGSLGTFDVVYSWGVLHHTGAMWEAIENVCGLVAPGGMLAISLYNDQGGASTRWRRVKRAYVNGSPLVQRALIGLSAVRLYGPGIAHRVIRGRSPAAFARELRARPRGMSAWHDLVDWVGGYPFEVAKPEEVFDFLSARAFVLTHLKTCGGGIGCNEFVLRDSRGQTPIR